MIRSLTEVEMTKCNFTGHHPDALKKRD